MKVCVDTFTLVKQKYLVDVSIEFADDDKEKIFLSLFIVL